MGAPCLKENIVGDGNCFFRAVSQAACGTQKHHRKIRLAIVKHLKANGGIFRSEYSSMEEYLTVSKMAYVGSWATEVEIQAAADFFGVSHTYCDGRWLEYSCKYRPFSYQGIYLENCNGNHYETVVCVQQPMQCCYGYCKVGRYNFRNRSVRADNVTSVASSICEGEVDIIEPNVINLRCSTLSVEAIFYNVVFSANLVRRVIDRSLKAEAITVMTMPTLLDPRFKKLGFLRPTKLDEAETRLKGNCAEIIRNTPSSTPPQQPETSQSTDNSKC